MTIALEPLTIRYPTKMSKCLGSYAFIPVYMLSGPVRLHVAFLRNVAKSQVKMLGLISGS